MDEVGSIFLMNVIIIAVFVAFSKVVLLHIRELKSDYHSYVRDMNYFIDRTNS